MQLRPLAMQPPLAMAPPPLAMAPPPLAMAPPPLAMAPPPLALSQPFPPQSFGQHPLRRTQKAT
jgi:hypothetical protein